MLSHQSIKIWVLAPFVDSGDENIDYYYDFSQSIREYEKVFEQLQINWQWQYVTCTNYKTIIQEIITDSKIKNELPIFFNLCDGDEVNGTPGIAVIQFLASQHQLYTGAKEYFYHITTSKANMKKAFDEFRVPNAKWFFIENLNQAKNLVQQQDLLFPLIIKPAISGGSMGVGIKNVVNNNEEFIIRIEEILNGYRGWNLNAGGIIAESFIVGPEFTVFLTGNYQQPEKAHIYTPVERVFHESLKEEEKFLSFDRLWEIYEDENPMPNEENFYNYQLADTSLIEPLQQLSWKAFEACKGTGYTRVDIRQDKKTKELFVLELNAQCGLSEDEDFTSIGAILKFSNTNFTNLVKEIIDNCLAEKNNIIERKQLNNHNTFQLIN